MLGLEPDATEAEIRRARRRLAKSLHPDLHDTRSRAAAERRMAAVNQAHDLLLALRAEQATLVPPAAGGDGSFSDSSFSDGSFSVEALPVDAFEAVLLAAVNLGDVMRAEDPYLLAVLLDHPGPCQCVLELAPDAGATTVSIEIGPRHFGTCPTLRSVRDAFVAEIRHQPPTP